MITKMKKLTFLIYHKEYEQFLQSIRDLGVVHVAEKAQGTAENTELQESIRLSNRYASTIKFLQSLNVELKEQKGDAARGEKALEEVEALQLEKTQLQHQLQACDKERAALRYGETLSPHQFIGCKMLDIKWISIYAQRKTLMKNGWKLTMLRRLIA